MAIPLDQQPDKENEKSEPVEPNLLVTLQSLLSDPKFLERLASVKKAKRPANTSRSGTYSYYRDVFALEIRAVVDQMIERTCDKEFFYSDYPELRPSSIYMRIWQGKKFLLDFLDPDGKYNQVFSMIEISREKTGVRLSWLRDKLMGKQFIARDVTIKDKTKQWKDEVEAFLQDRSMSTLHLKRLHLTTDEMMDLESSFNTIEGIDALITENEIKIIKSKGMYVDTPAKEEH